MRDLVWRQARAWGPPSWSPSYGGMQQPVDWVAAQMAYDSKIVEPLQPPRADDYIRGYKAGLDEHAKLARVIYEQGRAEGRRDAVAWMTFGLFMAGLLWTLVRYLLIAS